MLHTSPKGLDTVNTVSSDISRSRIEKPSGGLAGLPVCGWISASPISGGTAATEGLRNRSDVLGSIDGSSAAGLV